MTSPIKAVQFSQLLLDTENPRLAEEQPTQRDTLLHLTEVYAEKIINLAEHIVNNGFNPAVLPIIMPNIVDNEDNDEYEEDNNLDIGVSQEYIVLDGNRRIAAAKLLINPQIASKILSKSLYSKLLRLCEHFSSRSIDTINCIVVANREEADLWIQTLHRGEQKGVGTVGWDAQVGSTYDARMKGARKARPLQVLEFVKMYSDSMSPTLRDIVQRGKFPITNLERMIRNNVVSKYFGLETINNHMHKWYPDVEVLKPLLKLMEDLAGEGEKTTVTALKSREQRISYVESMPSQYHLDTTLRLDTPVPIEVKVELPLPEKTSGTGTGTTGDTGDAGTTDGTGTTGGTGGAGTTDGTGTTGGTGGAGTTDGTGTGTTGGTGGAGTTGETGTGGAGITGGGDLNRTKIVPSSCQLKIQHARIKEIYTELRKTPIADHKNALGALLRVFIELSVDFYLEHTIKWNEQQINKTKLSMRIDAIANYFKTNGIMKELELDPIQHAVNTQRPGITSIHAMHSLIHNRHAFADPQQLNMIWNSFQLFLENIWKK